MGLEMFCVLVDATGVRSHRIIIKVNKTTEVIFYTILEIEEQNHRSTEFALADFLVRT